MTHSSPANATCYVERSAVRQILIGSNVNNDDTNDLLQEVDALPIVTAEDFRIRAQCVPSREAALEAAALDFIAKVDRGEARSRKSYAAFKAALSFTSPGCQRVTGADGIVDEAACLIWAELCPGMVMGDEDRPHYEAAAKAVLALSQPAIQPQCAPHPIETAPKDGTHILAWRVLTGIRTTNNTNPPTVVHWFDDPDEPGFYTSVNERAPEHPFSPTHWMPLPNGPALTRPTSQSPSSIPGDSK